MEREKEEQEQKEIEERREYERDKIANVDYGKGEWELPPQGFAHGANTGVSKVRQ